MSTLGDTADVNLVVKFLPHTCNVCGRNLMLTFLALRRTRQAMYLIGKRSVCTVRIIRDTLMHCVEF